MARSPHPVRAHVELARLEIARGYDGLFRGEPEPVVVLGLFGNGRLLGRDQIAFTHPGDAAATLRSEKPHLARIGLPTTFASLGLLCVAIEHDSGEAVQSMYAALDRPIRIWRASDAVPHPQEPDDPEWLRAGGLPQPVEVLLDGADWRAALHGDDLVAASFVALPPQRLAHELRLSFVSPNGKNDWTALAHVQLV